MYYKSFSLDPQQLPNNYLLTQLIRKFSRPIRMSWVEVSKYTLPDPHLDLQISLGLDWGSWICPLKKPHLSFEAHPRLGTTDRTQSIPLSTLTLTQGQ